MNYKLLTPGPLTTTTTVKEAMMVDHCTWDEDYKMITQWVRRQLLDLAGVSAREYTTVLLQGSGSFGVEAVLSSVLKPTDKILVCVNGAYGQRMVQMVERYQIPHVVYQVSEAETFSREGFAEIFAAEPDISGIAVVHSETTSGILNDLAIASEFATENNLLLIVDAMSSFGGIPIDVSGLAIDFLVSSANKCIQGVPGFSFVICQKEALLASEGLARTVSLDLFDQYQGMKDSGKWRFTSPTHTVLAFQQALLELAEEGGIPARYQRYAANNRLLIEKMREIGFQTYIDDHQGPFITSFLYPENPAFDFENFYQYLKAGGYAIYPGKISQTDCFRIGNIGEIYSEDILAVIELIKNFMEENRLEV
ncbi:2-aminoethylphosphonate--pyruvate transaminase [Enterococcus sp. LJL90]